MLHSRAPHSAVTLAASRLGSHFGSELQKTQAFITVSVNFMVPAGAPINQCLGPETALFYYFIIFIIDITAFRCSSSPHLPNLAKSHLFFIIFIMIYYFYYFHYFYYGNPFIMGPKSNRGRAWPKGDAKQRYARKHNQACRISPSVSLPEI